MRTIKSVGFFLIFSILFSATAIANNSPKVIKKSSKVIQELRTEISSLIQNPKLKDNGITSETVKVRFKITDQNEIENILIKSDNEYLKTFVQDRLEKQSINLENLVPNQFYEVSFLFELR